MYKFAYDNRDGAKKLWRIGIINGYASVEVCELPTSFPTQSKITWSKVLDIGEAIDVDIALDGRWIKNETHEKWVFTTIREPWIFWVSNSGNLYVMQIGNQPFLLSENVTKASAIRGWKNTYHWNHDQGIVVGYLKNDGFVYYRNYCQQPPDQPALWEIERVIAELPTPAQDVALFRTNDYRTGFLCESNGQMYWTLTARNWANMAIEPHFISAGITDVSINFLPIVYADSFLEHKITAGISDVAITFLWGSPLNSFVNVYNEGDTTIHAICEHYLTDTSPSDFMVYDTIDAVFSVTGVEYGCTKNELIITVNSLAFSAPDDLTLKFLGGTTRGEAGQGVDPFEITFTPTGIEYVEVDPPKVQVIWNE